MEAINWHSVFFLIFAAAACMFAVAVVVSSNVVRMAFYLVMSLGAVAGLFFLAGAQFLGAMQLMVYVGGTMVLLIFGVMLTARGRFVSMQTGAGQWIVATVIATALLAVLLQTAMSVDAWKAPVVAEREVREETESEEAPAANVAEENEATLLGLALVGIRGDKLERQPYSSQGMSGYLLPFEIVSVHLLVVLIGAAYLARARRKKQQT